MIHLPVAVCAEHPRLLPGSQAGLRFLPLSLVSFAVAPPDRPADRQKWRLRVLLGVAMVAAAGRPGLASMAHLTATLHLAGAAARLHPGRDRPGASPSTGLALGGAFGGGAGPTPGNGRRPGEHALRQLGTRHRRGRARRPLRPPRVHPPPPCTPWPACPPPPGGRPPAGRRSRLRRRQPEQPPRSRPRPAPRSPHARPATGTAQRAQRRPARRSRVPPRLGAIAGFRLRTRTRPGKPPPSPRPRRPQRTGPPQPTPAQQPAGPQNKRDHNPHQDTGADPPARPQVSIPGLPIPSIGVTALKLAKRNQGKARTPELAQEMHLRGNAHAGAHDQEKGRPIDRRPIRRPAVFSMTCRNRISRPLSCHDRRGYCITSDLPTLHLRPRAAGSGPDSTNIVTATTRVKLGARSSQLGAVSRRR